jgi:hypothetical protein
MFIAVIWQISFFALFAIILLLYLFGLIVNLEFYVTFYALVFSVLWVFVSILVVFNKILFERIIMKGMKDRNVRAKEEYIEQYINLCSMLCKEPEDYTKSRVRGHNKAMRELIALDGELSGNAGLLEKAYFELLEDEDIYVQLTVAARCLNLGFHVDRAAEILEFIREKGDGLYCAYAERVLKVWRGEIRGDEAF